MRLSLDGLTMPEFSSDKMPLVWTFAFGNLMDQYKAG